MRAWVEHDLGAVGRTRTVLPAPAPALGRRSSTVDPTDPEVVQLAADLAATMRASAGCVGLAAPQIGVAAQVWCVDTTGHPRTHSSHGLLVLCNARVLTASRWQKSREGCLSVPHLTGDVKRAARLVVAGSLPGSGEEATIETDAFEARAIQHEIDHCDGLLFLDRVAGAHAVYPRQVYQ